MLPDLTKDYSVNMHMRPICSDRCLIHNFTFTRSHKACTVQTESRTLVNVSQVNMKLTYCAGLLEHVTSDMIKASVMYPIAATLKSDLITKIDQATGKFHLCQAKSVPGQ